jgi:uncharacterized membrane protein YgaE (UPF0421/DUF939 family)
MIAYLNGKKTYIIAGIMAIVAIAKGFGWIDQTAYEAVMGLLAALGFGALRAGVETIATECQPPK